MKLQSLRMAGWLCGAYVLSLATCAAGVIDNLDLFLGSDATGNALRLPFSVAGDLLRGLIGR